jgi:hypothetical protein
MLIGQAVHIELDVTEAQPMATECPACFAIVRKSRLAAHQEAAHGEAAE